MQVKEGEGMNDYSPILHRFELESAGLAFALALLRSPALAQPITQQPKTRKPGTLARPRNGFGRTCVRGPFV